jgi:coenzyme F420-reducing hydrogenase alpha subunit
MARYNLNFDQLSPVAQAAARDAGLTSVCRNPFQSIIIRSIEILYACDEALRIIAQYEPPEGAAIPAPVKPAAGCACTEAPRGILYHRYRISDRGAVLDAKIVPPTSQNQRVIEQDLSQFVSRFLTLPEPELEWRCEQAVRNYDPCISCATHFLKLQLDRR